MLAFREVQFTAIALILPLLLICYLTLRSSFGRLEDSKQHVAQLNRLLLSTVETLATAIDAKDEVTHDHVRRVQQGTLALAREHGRDRRRRRCRRSRRRRCCTTPARSPCPSTS